MALTATASQGFEFVRNVVHDEIMWVPGDPGDTYTPGDLVTFTVGEGIADPYVADEVPYGVVVGSHAIVCPSLATPFPRVGKSNQTAMWQNPPSAATRTLIPIRPLVPVGTCVHKATFASHVDDTVTSYLATTPYIAATTGHTGDDYPNGALVYVYSGPGAGEWNVVADYDHTGGAVELDLILHRAFTATLTSSSLYIVVTGQGASNKGVGFFGRIEGDHNNLVANNGADDGHWTVFLDAREVEDYLSTLMLPVIPSALLLFA